MKNNLLLITILFAFGTSIFAQVPSYVPTNGLIGWWPFNGNANDESGNGNNGTPNGPVLSEDRFGITSSSYLFNGNLDIITTSNSSIIGPSLSVSFWTKVDSISPAWFIVQGINQNGISYSFDLGAGLSDLGVLRQYVYNGSENWIGQDTLVANDNWSHVVYILSDLGMQLYINSILVASNPSVTSNQNLFGFWRFGGCTHPGQTALFGKLDDIGIWNRALTVCEIQDLYNAQLGTSSIENEIACENYAWNGNVYTQSGQYTFLTNNTNGCDSVATLNLTINQPSSSTQTEIALDSYTWPVNNLTYTESGTYTAVIPNSAGCDSTITLDLTLNFTGIEDQENSKIIISPNPARDYFKISASEELVGETYSIIDLNGKTLKEGTLTQKEQKIEIGNLSEGMYLFKIKNISEQTFRIVKN
jgi:hypothetical protein